MCLVLSLIPQSFTEQVRPKTKGEAKASDKATSKRRPAEEPYIYYVAGRWLHKLKKAGSFNKKQITLSVWHDTANPHVGRAALSLLPCKLLQRQPNVTLPHLLIYRRRNIKQNIDTQ